MTALLSHYREPDDCPYTWGFGPDRCSHLNLPMHRCIIQENHDHPCLCQCGSVPLIPPPWYAP